jgi:hypothetical protein
MTVVHVGAEGTLDGLKIDLVASVVTWARWARPEARSVDEGRCRRPVTTPSGPRGDELGVGIDATHVHTSPTAPPHALHPFGHVLRLGVDEGPNLVALNPLGREIAERPDP